MKQFVPEKQNESLLVAYCCALNEAARVRKRSTASTPIKTHVHNRYRPKHACALIILLACRAENPSHCAESELLSKFICVIQTIETH